jgi:outer membrane protein assembly factor BamD (BamD/ComL family)
MQQFRQDFQKLGQDLQAGNLSGAQADFAALQKDGPQSSSATQSSNPIAQGLQQLSSDLQSGNLTAAQQDYSNLQQDFQNRQPSGRTSSSILPGARTTARSHSCSRRLAKICNPEI